MTPATFPESNSVFTAPPDLSEEQCRPISAYVEEAKSGSCDGAPVIVVAWQPSREDLDRLLMGAPIFLTCIGGLPPHFLSTEFDQATHPA